MVVVIEPCHISTITAQGGLVMASSGLGSEMEGKLRWEGDIRVVFTGVGVEFGLMTMEFNRLRMYDQKMKNSNRISTRHFHLHTHSPTHIDHIAILLLMYVRRVADAPISSRLCKSCILIEYCGRGHRWEEEHTRGGGSEGL